MGVYLFHVTRQLYLRRFVLSLRCLFAVKMTKLLEWIAVAAIILGPWSAVVMNLVQNEMTDAYFIHILLFPIALVALFGVVSVAVIAYRVYTFNDCNEAADELVSQIREAKEDLLSKGLKVD